MSGQYIPCCNTVVLGTRFQPNTIRLYINSLILHIIHLTFDINSSTSILTSAFYLLTIQQFNHLTISIFSQTLPGFPATGIPSGKLWQVFPIHTVTRSPSLFLTQYLVPSTKQLPLLLLNLFHPLSFPSPFRLLCLK